MFPESIHPCEGVTSYICTSHVTHTFSSCIARALCQSTPYNFRYISCLSMLKDTDKDRLICMYIHVTPYETHLAGQAILQTSASFSKSTRGDAMPRPFQAADCTQKLDTFLHVLTLYTPNRPLCNLKAHHQSNTHPFTNTCTRAPLLCSMPPWYTQSCLVVRSVHRLMLSSVRYNRQGCTEETKQFGFSILLLHASQVTVWKKCTSALLSFALSLKVHFVTTRIS